MDVPSGVVALLESYALVADQIDVPLWILGVLTLQLCTFFFMLKVK